MNKGVGIYMRLFLACAIFLFSGYASAAKVSPFSALLVCKATAAWMMDKNPQIMRPLSKDGKEGDEVVVAYSEGMKTTKIHCRIQGEKVDWMLDGVRWLNSPEDPKISYEIKNGKIFIYQKFTDGSNDDGHYLLSRFK